MDNILKIPLNPPLGKGDLKTDGSGEFMFISYNLAKKVKSSRFKVQSWDLCENPPSVILNTAKRSEESRLCSTDIPGGVMIKPIVGVMGAKITDPSLHSG